MSVNQNQAKGKKIEISFLLCLFLGYFGAHKFYEGKNGLGVLYLCTFGLFGIGWIVNTISILLKIINKDNYANSTALTEKEIPSHKTNNIHNVTLEEHKQQLTKYLDINREEFNKELSEIPKVEFLISNENINRCAASDIPEIYFSNITRATNIDKLFPFVVVDVETTGLEVNTNDIIEVSAIKYDVGFRAVSCFTSLLKPQAPIPPKATAINHITDDMVADCPMFSQIASSFSKYIEGCNVIGHNLNFDLKFLQTYGADFSNSVKYFDTLQLARRTLTKNEDVCNYKLETLCDYYNIYYTAHRSLSDCYATGRLFKEVIYDKISR